MRVVNLPAFQAAVFCLHTLVILVPSSRSLRTTCHRYSSMCRSHRASRPSSLSDHHLPFEVSDKSNKSNFRLLFSHDLDMVGVNVLKFYVPPVA